MRLARLWERLGGRTKRHGSRVRHGTSKFRFEAKRSSIGQTDAYWERPWLTRTWVGLPVCPSANGSLEFLLGKRMKGSSSNLLVAKNPRPVIERLMKYY
jgi:hypothetical protein